MQGVSGDQQPYSPTAELLLKRVSRGTQQLAQEGQTANPRQLDHGPQAGSDRRERRNKTIHQARTNPLPLINKGLPSRPVSWMLLVQQLGCDIQVAVQDHP